MMHANTTAARIYAVSDLHAERAENANWVTAIDGARHLARGDVLIVAGDVSDSMDVVRDTLVQLKARFASVMFCPGNHDLWVARGAAGDSMSRLAELEAMCREIGVSTEPVLVEDLCWVCPLHSWYLRTSSPQSPPKGYSESRLLGWMDFHSCRWDEAVGAAASFTPAEKLQQAGRVARLMLERNEPRLEALEAMRGVRGLPLVTFSHFLPRADLLPATERLSFKELVDVAICTPLDAQLRQAESSVHVFGHTHIQSDVVIDGVRYVQHALGYPKESWAAAVRRGGLKQVFP